MGYSGFLSMRDDRSKVQMIGLLICFPLFLVTFGLPRLVSASVGEIKARAAVAIDAATGRILYAKNASVYMMPASTAKLMTALVVLEHARLDDVVIISRKAADTAATDVGLLEGDRVTVEALLHAALITSANDAAVALAEAAAGSEDQFVQLMNRKAHAIGADDTRFINATGLPGKGQHITAHDLAKIMREAIQHPQLKEILNTRVAEVSTQSGKTILITNTNRLLWSNEEIIGGKTGYTRQARHCFVCAGGRENGTIIVAVLGAPSRDLLWTESGNLMTFGSRVLGHLEEPVVYLTKSEYGPGKATKASHKRKLKNKKKKRTVVLSS